MTLPDRLREVRCDREPFAPEHAECVCRLANGAADRIETLETRIVGLEAMLVDAQAEIAALKFVLSHLRRHSGECVGDHESWMAAIDRLLAGGSGN